MPFSTEAKNAMLDSQTMDGIMLHSNDPGPVGDNFQESGINAATFGAAATSRRTLTADVDVVGMAASADVTFFSVWTTAGAVFKGSGTISSGDIAANAAGEYTLTTASYVELTD